ncbi:transketolase family protein [bacterium]
MAEGGLSYTIDDVNDLTQGQIFGQTIVDLAKDDPDIVCLTADLAKSTKIGTFFSKYPERSFNIGIAEQNMVSVAAGLALAGKKPYLATFACFAAMRACEQVRTDLCYPNLNVKIIGTHAGLSMGNGGTTHHATEDLAIMRSFANMMVTVPADGIETGRIIQASINHVGPLYMRIGRGFEPPAYDSIDYDFELGKAITMREGTDATIIACGVCVLQAMEAAEELAEDGKNVRVINMHTIKPLDVEAVLAAAETGVVITAEEHNVIGGLGGAVAEVLMEAGAQCKFKRIGIPDCFSVIGYPDDLYGHYGIDMDGIYKTSCGILGLEARDLDGDFDDDDDDD